MVVVPATNKLFCVGVASCSEGRRLSKYRFIVNIAHWRNAGSIRLDILL